ncbi:hypothetical protein BDV96DRAFT_570968 [Lophiotrema nucula]|uniref:CCZ1/INTU/HSP4 first Longin domain-containing protein n=1 Tax=Lophiotrema nucula TaxID=690887 RepID=A0A6A5ZFV4_9PLEO|nr:hypothetical protein BDV96DRAFT_570968 [Lophiotrema nucula]
MSSTAIPKVVPAQLSFLAVYNPSLGDSDETFHDQIVFYYSKAAKARSKLRGKDAQAERNLREEENEKLRQVGLAQGMVGFARSFSSGEAVDSVETHKSRIVLKELEKGWWILASIDLTQLPSATSRHDSGVSATSAHEIEYSSREVSPPALLLQQLTKAHSVFLLHHGSNFSDLFRKLDRQKFCNILDRYWSRFANTWDVLLHGSPAVDIYSGLKLAAGGELGIGVGEEEWGSGEREVLEDYARRTEGLVDIVVSRFGEPSPLQDPKASPDSKALIDTSAHEPWIGGGKYVGAADGVFFSGIGALSRRSLRDVSYWVETIYHQGENAYGVRDNPTADRRKRRRRVLKTPLSGRASPEANRPQHLAKPDGSLSSMSQDTGPRIPPPIFTAVEASLDKASNAVESSEGTQASKSEPFMASLGDTETWVKYLTLGYGSAWGGRKTPNAEQESTSDAAPAREPSPEVSMRYIDPEPDVDKAEEKIKAQIQHENSGYFIIGLKGDMGDEDYDDENDEGGWNNRIPLRTVHVEIVKEEVPDTPHDDTPLMEQDFSFGPNPPPWLRRLRPVVYVHRPFIYTFLFHHRTEALSVAPFYRDLHTYFAPLHRPLSNSTSPSRVAARIAAASHPTTTISASVNANPDTQPIYDLVYDPRTLTIHSSIPNIPEPGTLIAEGISSNTIISDWSRVEALNVHSQILANVSSTRRTLSEIERTCKTSRGWWVVWMRLPPSEDSIRGTTTGGAASSKAASQIPSQTEGGQVEGGEYATTEEFDSADLREAFLVRRSRDAVSTSGKTSSGSRLGSGMWKFGGQSTGEKMGGAAAGWGPKGLAEGIGVDARRYVEGLLSLNR